MNPGDLRKDMGTMETSISDLQGELDVANEPSRKHFRPGGLLLALLVAILVGGSAFIAVNRFTRVDDNTAALKESCLVRNDQIRIVNDKFGQLVVLLDASLADRQPGEPPPTEEILRLYAEFRKPIELLPCPDL